MLTNFKTMQERIKRLKDLQSKMDSGELASRYNKLEVQRFQEEIDALENSFGGIKDLGGLPGAVFVADVVSQANAVKEANKLGVPIVGIVDTNGDPRPINYPIPANDDAIKTQELIISLVAEAINRGQAKAKAAPKKVDEAAQKTEQKTETEVKKTDVQANQGRAPANTRAKSAKQATVKKPAKSAKSKAKPAAKAKTDKKASK
jgi:small subunit ribosomal protein S2